MSRLTDFTDRLTRYTRGDRRDPRTVLEEIFGTAARGAGPQPEAQRWGHEQLVANGVDPTVSPVAAIRVLRQAEPKLGLKTATYLAQSLGR